MIKQESKVDSSMNISLTFVVLLQVEEEMFVHLRISLIDDIL